MPNIKSAKKRVKTNKRKSVYNNTTESSRKTAVKKLERNIKAGDKKNAKDDLNVAIKRIDKSAKAGLIKPNKAARLKSRLTKSVNNME